MKFKSFLSKNKKILAFSIGFLFLGIILGNFASPSANEINSAQARNASISSEISNNNTLIESNKSEITNLSNQVSTLENKKDSIEEKLKSEKEKQEQIKAQQEKEKQEQIKAQQEKEKQASHNNSTSSSSPKADNHNDNNVSNTVWITATGKKYHRTNHCGRTNPNNARQVSLEEAQNMGLSPCSKCF